LRLHDSTLFRKQILFSQTDCLISKWSSPVKDRANNKKKMSYFGFILQNRLYPSASDETTCNKLVNLTVLSVFLSNSSCIPITC